MVTSPLWINTSLPVGSHAIFHLFLSAGHKSQFYSKMGGTNTFKIILFSIMISHVILFSLASPVEAKKKEEKSTPQVTTIKPVTASTAKNLNKEEAQILNNARTEKPATKKREIPDILADRLDYTDDDFYGDKSGYDDNTYQVARPYFENFRNENPDLDSDGYKGVDYRNYIEARRKRMAKANSREDYYESPMQPTGQELIYRQYPFYTESNLNRYLKGRWMGLNYPMDALDGDVENDDMYNDRQSNYLERLDDPRFQNVAYSPMNGQIMGRRVRRSNLTKPGFYFPVLRRAIL